MRRLWNDIGAHKATAAVLFGFWLILLCLDIFGWRKPAGRDDMLSSVLYLMLFSAVLAGGLVGWWRRSGTGQVSGGMLAGGALLALAAAAIVIPQMVRSSFSGAHDNESILELPMILVLVGLMGSVLGLAGGAIVVGVLRLAGERKPGQPAAVKTEEQPPARRMRFVAAALALGAALIVAIAVVPPVAADYYPGAAPDRAAKAFGVAAAVNIAVALVLFAPFARGRTILTMTGFVALLLGCMLLSAASIGGRGPALFIAAIASGVCAAADFAAAALTFWSGRRANL